MFTDEPIRENPPSLEAAVIDLLRAIDRLDAFSCEHNCEETGSTCEECCAIIGSFSILQLFACSLSSGLIWTPELSAADNALHDNHHRRWHGRAEEEEVEPADAPAFVVGAGV